MVKVSSLVESLTGDKNFNNCRLLVFNENNRLIVCEMVQHLLYKTYKMLKNYEIVSFTTDNNARQDTINVCVVFGKFINENE